MNRRSDDTKFERNAMILFVVLSIFGLFYLAVRHIDEQDVLINKLKNQCEVRK